MSTDGFKSMPRHYLSRQVETCIANRNNSEMKTDTDEFNAVASDYYLIVGILILYVVPTYDSL